MIYRINEIYVIKTKRVKYNSENLILVHVSDRYGHDIFVKALNLIILFKENIHHMILFCFYV